MSSKARRELGTAQSDSGLAGDARIPLPPVLAARPQHAAAILTFR